MDQVEIIAAASGAFGFGVGYLLAYTLTRRDVIRDVTMRIDAMRRTGVIVAENNKGQVPWSAVESNLRRFPGQRGNR
jgi:hypothetical protein